MAELKNGEIKRFDVYPEQLGIKETDDSALEGGTAHHNAVEMNKLLAGNGLPAYRDIVALNAGASLYIAGEAVDLKDGVKQAQEMLETDKPQQLLQALVKISNE